MNNRQRAAESRAFARKAPRMVSDLEAKVAQLENEKQALLDHIDLTSKPRPMHTAPRDGTWVKLKVEYDSDNGPWQPLIDAHACWTIGYNDYTNTGEDRWHVVGWNWEQDVIASTNPPKLHAWLPFNVEVKE